MSSRPNALKLTFRAVFEGMTLCSEDPLADGSLPYYSRDANFIQAIKQNITASLIGGYFQPAPSMGTFVQVVRNIEGLVDVGKIRTIHEVKVALLWAARVRPPSRQADEHVLICAERWAIYRALRSLFKTCARVLQKHVLPTASRTFANPDSSPTHRYYVQHFGSSHF